MIWEKMIMNKNILSTKNRFLGSNFEISKSDVGKAFNPYLTRDSENYPFLLVKSLPTVLKIASETNKIRSWYSYQHNLKLFYQLGIKNLGKPCRYCFGNFTNKMAKKVMLVNSQISFYQGFKAKIKKRATTLYINIYRNPP